MSKAQETGSILKVDFAWSKGPHFHRVYLVTVCKRSSMAVYGSDGICDTIFYLSMFILQLFFIFWIITLLNRKKNIPNLHINL